MFSYRNREYRIFTFDAVQRIHELAKLIQDSFIYFEVADNSKNCFLRRVFLHARRWDAVIVLFCDANESEEVKKLSFE